MQCEIVLFGTCPELLGVAQQGYSSHDPVVRGHCCLQEEGARWCRWGLCALKLLVHRALVEPGVLRPPSVVHCIDMHHWQWNKEDFVGRFCMQVCSSCGPSLSPQGRDFTRRHLPQAVKWHPPWACWWCHCTASLCPGPSPCGLVPPPVQCDGVAGRALHSDWTGHL